MTCPGDIILELLKCKYCMHSDLIRRSSQQNSQCCVAWNTNCNINTEDNTNCSEEWTSLDQPCSKMQRIGGMLEKLSWRVPSITCARVWQYHHVYWRTTDKKTGLLLYFKTTMQIIHYMWETEDNRDNTKEQALLKTCNNATNYLIDLPAPHQFAMTFPNMLNFGPTVPKNLLRYDR